ncbi:hypothetical protein K505DRAFT_295631 [Melanomma pulvis-pyrius CBS 109.77]|uniref:Uncharacterized protein n=1 Tax=Melanomma pulvis-pyrius CBS 109.77 TaxID=1314802 RepID=A0A6A6XRS1_9PLEO|nr:hypothetical protein K505DRAFT_295631 [Melanomma pulvis-pyrius CBS 109.77]
MPLSWRFTQILHVLCTEWELQKSQKHVPKKSKTYNSRDSPMVTHLTTSLPVS